MIHSGMIFPMRRRPPDRLGQLISSALRVFGEKGYRRAQMADVARDMGVSPGTLYNYVASKEALFHLVVDRAFLTEPGGAPPSLPIPPPPPGVTLHRLRERLRTDVVLPRLEAALAQRPTLDPRSELESIVRELYDVVERSRQGIVVLERSALELPELARVFYLEMRRRLVARLGEYLQSRARRGQLRAVPNPAAAARLILEAVAAFAMHRHRDPDPAAIDDATARETVIDFVASALAPDEPPKARKRKGAGS
jgi:AcrR family transcriptional regulator